MESSGPAEAPRLPPDAIEFVRFCYRRRRVGWPELYDEMCAVASRGLYRGWRFAELAERGIGFSLQETPELARIAGQVALEEGDRRGRPFGRAATERAATERAAAERAAAEQATVQPRVGVGESLAPDLAPDFLDVRVIAEPVRTTSERVATMAAAVLVSGAH